MVELPAGYRRIWSGRVRIGDKYLNHLKAWKGVYEFCPITKTAIENEYYRDADLYALIVRPAGHVVRAGEGKACTRCKARPAEPKSAVCDICTMFIRDQLRKDFSRGT